MKAEKKRYETSSVIQTVGGRTRASAPLFLTTATKLVTSLAMR